MHWFGLWLLGCGTEAEPPPTAPAWGPNPLAEAPGPRPRTSKLFLKGQDEVVGWNPAGIAILRKDGRPGDNLRLELVDPQDDVLVTALEGPLGPVSADGDVVVRREGEDWVSVRVVDGVELRRVRAAPDPLGMGGKPGQVDADGTMWWTTRDCHPVTEPPPDTGELTALPRCGEARFPIARFFDRRGVLSVAKDGVRWIGEDGGELRTFSRLNTPARLSPDGKTLAMGLDGEAVTLDLDTLEKTVWTDTRIGPVSVAWNEKGTHLAALGHSKLLIWKLDTPEPEVEVVLDHTVRKGRPLLWSPRNWWLATWVEGAPVLISTDGGPIQRGELGDPLGRQVGVLQWFDTEVGPMVYDHDRERAVVLGPDAEVVEVLRDGLRIHDRDWELVVRPGEVDVGVRATAASAP